MMSNSVSQLVIRRTMENFSTPGIDFTNSVSQLVFCGTMENFSTPEANFTNKFFCPKDEKHFLVKKFVDP